MLGFFVGILLTILIVTVQIYLNQRVDPVKKVVDLVEKSRKRTGSVIFPKSDAEKSIEEKIEESKKNQQDINIDDIV